MKAAVIKDGIVDNVVIVNKLEEGMVELVENSCVGIGDFFDGNVFTKPEGAVGPGGPKTIDLEGNVIETAPEEATE